MADIIKIRRDTAANWTTTNPILALNELAYETDTGRFKRGDGTATWTALPYLLGSVVGDLLAPGNNKLYGTNGAGAKGWYDAPAGGGSGDDPPHGGIYFTTDVLTEIANQSVYVKAEGTTEYSSMMQFEVDDNGVNNRLRYTGTDPLHFHIVAQASLTFASGTNQIASIQIYHYDASAATGALNAPSRADSIVAGSGVTQVTTHTDLHLETNDYLELHIANRSNANNMTVLEGYLFIMGMIPQGSEINTASNVGTGDGQLFKDKVVADLRFRRLIAGTNVTISTGTDDVTINSAGGSGEINTASNVGTGTGVWKEKVGVDLRFKSLVAGTNITFDTTDPDEIELNASGGSGEINTASNVGIGDGDVFKEKVGVDLRFRKLVAGPNISIFTDTDTVEIEASGGGGGVTAIATVATSGATQTVDFNTNRMSKITLSANCTITLTDGASATDHLTGTLQLIQDSTAREVTWGGTNIVFPGGVEPQPTAGSGDISLFMFEWNGQAWIFTNLIPDVS